MSLWGLATCGAAPHKAWLMAWFLSSRASMQRASTQVRESAHCALQHLLLLVVCWQHGDSCS